MKKLLPVFFALLILSSCKKKDENVAVASVTIDNGANTNAATASVHLGETLTLKATVLPDNATSKEVTWESSQPSTATVAGGVVTPVKEGETIISASAGGITAKCTVTVLPKFLPLTSISFNPAKAAIVIKEKKTLTPLLTPAEASDKTIEWSSDNNDIATVSQGGEVEAKKVGTCKITVKSAKSPTIAATCEVEVVAAPIPLTGLTAIPADTTVEKGISFQLRHRIEPANATTNTEVTYLSSDVTKATVSEKGLVTASTITTTPITITIKSKGDASKTATCTLTIIPAKVRVTSITISPDAPKIPVEQKQQLTATVLPSEATNKTVTWRSSDESKATVSDSGEVTAGTTVGEVYITATAKDGSGKVGTATVTVIPRATAITINPAEPAVAVVGITKTITLTVSVTPENAGKAVTWRSSTVAVATIDANGVVTGKALGSTTITATAADGSNVSTTKTVTVKSSEASLTAMILGTANLNYPVTPTEGQTVNLYNAARTFYSNITAVPVNVTVTAGATIKIGTTPFNSGGTVDFTNPVAFIVTAEDGATTKTYTVGIPTYDATTNPYGIYTAVQLSDVRNALDKSYKLMNDIALPDLSAQAATDLAIPSYDTKGWEPIGDVTTRYSGIFDGNNHLITNLRIDRSTENYVALFGVTAGTCTIKKLGVASAGISGNLGVAAIVGGVGGGTLITHCSSTGTITGATDNGIGGIAGVLGEKVGDRGQVISNCYSSCVVTAITADSYKIGGLVGGSWNGTVTNCYATGTASITGSVRPGGRAGLVGDNSYNGTIITCYATGGNGVTSNTSFNPDRSPRSHGTVTDSYYPVGQLGSSDGGEAISAGATRASFENFDFDNVWIWTAGQWPKLRNVPGTQPTVNLPQ